MKWNWIKRRKKDIESDEHRLVREMMALSGKAVIDTQKNNSEAIATLAFTILLLLSVVGILILFILKRKGIL